MEKNTFEVIIIGGSYSGLAAALALGRALVKVLVVDGGEPCNKQTPHSNNFLTQDGTPPGEIHRIAKSQVMKYDTIQFLNGMVTHGRQLDRGTFEIVVGNDVVYEAKQLIFATGIKDHLPSIPGLAACWGISVIHCPYCHGYEVRNEPTGILSNGREAIEIATLIYNWTKDLTILTNGRPDFSEEEELELKRRNIKIDNRRILQAEHRKGELEYLVMEDNLKLPLKAIYHRPGFSQHCEVPLALGCELTEDGYIRVDGTQSTTVEGVFACGDNTTRMRAVANAVFMGTMAGVAASKKVIMEGFNR